MKNKILELINNGMDIEEVTGKVYKNECMDIELKEDFPKCWREVAECFECWKRRVIKIQKRTREQFKKGVPFRYTLILFLVYHYCSLITFSL